MPLIVKRTVWTFSSPLFILWICFLSLVLLSNTSLKDPTYKIKSTLFQTLNERSRVHKTANKFCPLLPGSILSCMKQCFRASKVVIHWLLAHCLLFQPLGPLTFVQCKNPEDLADLVAISASALRKIWRSAAEKTTDLIDLKRLNLYRFSPHAITGICQFPFRTGRHSRFPLYPNGPGTIAIGLRFRGSKIVLDFIIFN